MKIQLKDKEARILKDALSLAGYAVDMHPYEKGEFLFVDEDQADTIRNICSEYLLAVGFDEDYSTTEEGVILEGLIDTFYMG